MSIEKLIGEMGSFTCDNSFTNSFVYAIYVQSDCVFTTLKEKNETSDTPLDVMAQQNKTGKTIYAGTTITPYKEWFSDVTISSGQIECYRLGI